MLTPGREKFQELLHWFTSRGHPVQPHIRATDTCHQAKEGLLDSVSNYTRYVRTMKRGQAKKTWCCTQVLHVPPATTFYTVQVQGGSHSLPPHPPPAQSHPMPSCSWACPRMGWSWAHCSQWKDSRWLQRWGLLTLRQMWENKIQAGLWFHCLCA